MEIVPKIHVRSRFREMLVRLTAYVTIVVALVVTLFPIYWIAANSFKFDIDIFAVPPEWVPKNPTLKHYDEAFIQRPFLRYALNSFLVAVGTSFPSASARWPAMRWRGSAIPGNGAGRFRSGSCRRA